jgi:hypothetical protein
MAKWNEGLRIEASLGRTSGFSSKNLFTWLNQH